MTNDELTITRIIRHPREQVFEAWTDPNQLVRWFAPRGCTILILKLEIREGGRFHWCIKNPKYPDCWCIGEFIKLQHPSLLQYKIRLADETGNPVSSQEVFKDEEWPEETLVTVTFNDRENDTELIIKQTVIETVARKTGAYHSWIEMLDILEEQLVESPTNMKV